MDHRKDQNSDISQSQSAQQPHQKDRSEENRQTNPGGLDQSRSEADAATETEQRRDIADDTGPATDTGFIGTEGLDDTSSEPVEDDDPDFAKDGQGSIE